jgi:hypothetical protein
MSIHGPEELTGRADADGIVPVAAEAAPFQSEWTEFLGGYALIWQLARPRFSRYCWW